MTEEFYCNDSDAYVGVLSLIGAMFRLAAQDAKYGRREEVLEFVESEWFVEICDCLELNPNDVKERIFTSKVKQRDEYR